MQLTSPKQDDAAPLKSVIGLRPTNGTVDSRHRGAALGGKGGVKFQREGHAVREHSIVESTTGKPLAQSLRSLVAHLFAARHFSR